MAHKVGEVGKRCPSGFLAFVSKAGRATAKKMKWNHHKGPKKIDLGGDKIDKKSGCLYFVKGKGIFEARLKNAKSHGKKKGKSKKSKRGRRR